MFGLEYNIDFEITAFIFTFILYIEVMVCYPKKSRKNYVFLNMTLLVLITQIFDMLSAFTNTYEANVPVWFNKFINSGYFMAGLYLCYMLYYYVESVFLPKYRKNKMIRINKMILIVVEFTFVLNWIYGFYFYFGEGGVYTHGPLYLLMHITSIWFVICASFELIIHRKILKRVQFVSGILFVLMHFSAVILQTFFFQNVFLIMPAASAMLIIALFNLETPDYIELQKTLQELTETKKKLEIANEKYKKLAHEDLMTGLYNRTAYITHLGELKDNKDAILFMGADINDLKYINDNYGHIAGDDMIIKVAELLEREFSTGCYCYRMGGDEFFVIGYDISKQSFEKCYRRFLEDVEKEELLRSYPFSIASAYQEVGARTFMEALKDVDFAMYENKKQIKMSKEVKS